MFIIMTPFCFPNTFLLILEGKKHFFLTLYWTSQVALLVKNPSASAGDVKMRVLSLGQEDLLEEGVATHSSIHTWRIPWTEEPGMPQSTGLQRVRHN